MISVNTKKVLANKNKPTVEDNFRALIESHSPVNVIKYINYLRELPLKEILENSQYVYGVPNSGPDFLLSVLKSNDLTVQDLNIQKKSITEYAQKALKRGISPTTEHLTSLAECVKLIDEKIIKYDDINYVIESYKMDVCRNYLPKPILESSMNKSMDKIILDINHDPSVAEDYTKLVNDIKNAKKNVVTWNFPELIVKNTTLVIGVTVIVAGTIATLMISLPLLIVSKLLQDRTDKKYINAYISILDTQMQKVDTARSSESDESKKGMLDKYYDSLSKAKSKLQIYYNKLNKKSSVSEGFNAGVVKLVLFNRHAIDKLFGTNYEAEKVKEIKHNYSEQLSHYKKIMSKINKGDTTTIELMKSQHGMYYKNYIQGIIDGSEDGLKAIREKEAEQRKMNKKPATESFSNVDPDDIDGIIDAIDIEADINSELDDLDYGQIVDDKDDFDSDVNNYDDEDDLSGRIEEIDFECALLIADCANSDDKISLEAFNKLIKLLNEHTVIQESAADVSRNIGHGIRKGADQSRRTAVAVAKVPEHIDNAVNHVLDSIKKWDKDERKKRILEGGFKTQLLKWVRNAITLGVAFWIHPALAAIALLSGVAMDIHADDKVRREILHDLEIELKLTEEKIEDSRGDANKNKKYELIRIKHKLDDEIRRIRYRLDD